MNGLRFSSLSTRIAGLNVALYHFFPCRIVNNLQQSAVDRLSERAAFWQGNGIVVHCQGLRQDVEFMPAVVLDHVTQDGLVIDHCAQYTLLRLSVDSNAQTSSAIRMRKVKALLTRGGQEEGSNSGIDRLKALDTRNWSAMRTTCQSGCLFVTDKTNTIG
jgi:hypothetical protein